MYCYGNLYTFRTRIAMYSDWNMTAIVEVQRRAKGQVISKLDDQIERLDGLTYKVRSQSGNGFYIVKFSTLKDWSCSCPDHVYREIKCKHIWAVEFSLRIRDKVRENVVIQPVVIDACLYCKSKVIFKDGLRHNKYGDLQIWNCKACGRYFTINVGFERMKHSPQGITTAMQLYFAGESLRNVTRSLQLIGVEVSYQTVWNWIQKYTALMEKYLERITPQVSDTWRADELYLKVHGKMNYLYALMDDQTRFWIAQEVAGTKFTADIRPLFANGKRIAGKKPKVLITDGAPNFHEAFQREFTDGRRYYNPQHIQDIRMEGTVHNNKMERMNGEIRDREKVMRSLKKPDTPILAGYQIFHNYIRPHMALDGQTPADKAGIEIRGHDKWRTIIQNASRKVN
jgi:transposase-like protein